jgi:DNA recombination protein RmuC
MLTTIAVILLIVALAAVAWFLSQLKNSTSQNEKLTNELHSKLRELDEYKMNSIRLSTEKEGLIQQLENERKLSIEKQAELKRQLELIGKDIVIEGNKALKTENEQQLNHLLNPLKEKLEKFEAKVNENKEHDIKRYANMESLIKVLSEQHSQMNSTAQNLVNALKGEQKTQGNWGEMALERILESSGLENGREYHLQSSYRNEQGELLRPDVVIQLPDDKHIIIDAKVSLKAFEQYINSEDPEEKKTALANHLISIKSHIKGLGEKDYSHLPGITTPDFVLLFMPIESSFSLAMKEEPTLYQIAWEKKVVIVTPSTLLATLKTVEGLWKHERQNRHAHEIAEQAGRLYDKFVNFVGDLEKVGSKQKEAIKSYDEAMSKLSEGKGNLTRSAEKLKELGVKSKKQLDQKFLDDDNNSIDINV